MKIKINLVPEILGLLYKISETEYTTSDEVIAQLIGNHHLFKENVVNIHREAASRFCLVDTLKS